jgi:hypothetical protein
MASVEAPARGVSNDRPPAESPNRGSADSLSGIGVDIPIASIDPTGSGSGAGSSRGAGTETQFNARTILPIDGSEIILCLAALAVWLFFLTVGITIATPPMVNAVQSGTMGWFSIVGYLVVIVFCHTVPNMAILCCLSAFLGVVASRAVSGVPQSGPTQERLSIYVAAVTRGFFVFLVIVSGTILLSEQSFMNLTQERYIRLTGLASLFSFAVGYNPSVFVNLLERVTHDSMGGAERKKAAA